jgi:hypothetical protein
LKTAERGDAVLADREAPNKAVPTNRSHAVFGSGTPVEVPFAMIVPKFALQAL